MGDDAQPEELRAVPAIALVTGASSGVGRAIAFALAREGVHVLAMGRRLEALRQLDSDIAADTGHDRVTPVPCDVCDLAQIDRVSESVCVWPGRLDLLIHCAGEIRFGGIDSATTDDAELLWKTHVQGPMRLTQRLLGLLRASRGQIVFINSSAAVSAPGNRLAYASSKAAAKSLADCLRESLSQDGIRVMSFLLGRVDTPMQQRVLEYEHRTLETGQLMPPGDVAKAVLITIRLPRTVEVTDVHLRQPSA